MEFLNKVKSMMLMKVGPLQIWQWLALLAAVWYFLIGRKKTGGAGRFRSAYTRARSYVGRGYGYARRTYSRARRCTGRTYRRTAGRFTARGRTAYSRARAWSRPKYARR
jgi:hypothetical protein